MTAVLTAADLLFINRVASRRFAAAEPATPDAAAIQASLATGADGPVLRSATAVVAALLTRNAFPTVPQHTALLVLHCWLSLQGLSLLAPQGVLAGMIRGLASDADLAAFERWLEDRTVPSASDA